MKIFINHILKLIKNIKQIMKLLNKLKYFNAGSLNIKRAPYKVIDQSDIEYFRTFMNSNHIITDPI